MLKTLKTQSKKKIILAIKIKNFIKHQLWQHFIVVAFVCFCGWLFAKPFESLMFCISHSVIRPRFEKQYHCPTTALCLITTLVIAWFGISYLLPIGVSLLSSIPTGFAISYFGYVMQDRTDILKSLKQLKETLNQKPNFHTDTCTETELVARCKELGMNEHDINIAIELFIKKTKQSKVADMLCIEEKSVQQRKRRLKQKLNKH